MNIHTKDACHCARPIPSGRHYGRWGETDIQCGKLIVGRTALEIMRRREAAKAKAAARRRRARIVGGLPVEDGETTSGERGTRKHVRTCETCGKEYTKPFNVSWGRWHQSRFCSRECHHGRAA